MIAAVIPAAGSGSRFRTDAHQVSKQLLDLCGRPVYIWSVLTSAVDERVSDVVIPTSENLVAQLRTDVDRYIPIEVRGKIHVITGGATRQESVFMGLKRLSELTAPPSYVYVHDAARPFLTKEMISDTIASVTEYGACTLALPVTDTIMTQTDGLLGAALNRDKLISTQTPQAGRFDWLLAGHQAAVTGNLSTTDDASILSASGHRVHIVKGSRYNVKITTHEDFTLCEFLANTAFRKSY